MNIHFPSLSLMGLLVVFAVFFSLSQERVRGQERSQDADGRTLGAEEEADLYRWAEERLRELDRMDAEAAPSPERRMDRLRALYFTSVKEGKRVERAEALLEELRGTIPERGEERVVMEAIAGALEVVRAKHSRWPPNKLKHLRKGMEILDRLVEEHPEHLEVRYLRLVSCFYLPFFLKREESVEQDMATLVQLLPDRPRAFSPAVYRGVVEFVLENGDLGPEEQARLEKAVS